MEWAYRHPSEECNSMRHSSLSHVWEKAWRSFPQDSADVRVHPSETVLEALTSKDLRRYS
jgi:hypothetical protein